MYDRGGEGKVGGDIGGSETARGTIVRVPGEEVGNVSCGVEVEG